MTIFLAVRYEKASYNTLHLQQKKRCSPSDRLYRRWDSQFSASFFPYLSEYIAASIVAPVPVELLKNHPPAGDIALIHIDSPKLYSGLKPIFSHLY